MAHAITLIRTSEGKWEVLTLPDVSVDSQRRAFKSFRSSPPEGAEEVQLWTSSSGRTRRLRLSRSSPAPVSPEAEETEEDRSPAKASKSPQPPSGKKGTKTRPLD